MDRKDSYSEVFLKAAGLPHDEKAIETVRAIWWYSTREKDSGGLRLTDPGIEFIETKADIKIYKIDIPKEVSITPQVLVWLDQYIDSPFHFTKKHIKVLSERAAFELYLFSGDVKKLGLARSLAKRRSQESTTD
jgi:hypothetical protein